MHSAFDVITKQVYYYVHKVWVWGILQSDWFSTTRILAHILLVEKNKMNRKKFENIRKAKSVNSDLVYILIKQLFYSLSSNMSDSLSAISSYSTRVRRITVKYFSRVPRRVTVHVTWPKSPVIVILDNSSNRHALLANRHALVPRRIYLVRTLHNCEKS
jgi:hypothetical protein